MVKPSLIKNSGTKKSSIALSNASRVRRYMDLKNREYKMWMRALSEKTQETYEYTLMQFFDYIKENDLKVSSMKDLMDMDSEELQTLLEDYTMELADRGKSRNTVKLYLTSIESFLVFHDVSYKKKKLHRLFPAKSKPAGSQGYTVDEIADIVNGFSTLRGKAMVLTIASSGMRRGGYADLKVGDMIPIEDCYLIRVYAGTPDEYVTFCTPEARKYHDMYMKKRKKDGENITNDTMVFKRNANEKGTTDRSRMVSSNICQVIKKIEMNKEKTQSGRNTRYNKATVHGMRKFFNTQLNKAKIASNDIEKMMGHQNGLKGLYYDPESNDLYKDYKQAVPLLTILKENRQEFEITELKNQSVRDEVVISRELIDQKQEIEMLKRQLALYQNDGTVSKAENDESVYSKF